MISSNSPSENLIMSCSPSKILSQPGAIIPPEIPAKSLISAVLARDSSHFGLTFLLLTPGPNTKGFRSISMGIPDPVDHGTSTMVQGLEFRLQVTLLPSSLTSLSGQRKWSTTFSGATLKKVTLTPVTRNPSAQSSVLRECCLGGQTSQL